MVPFAMLVLAILPPSSQIDSNQVELKAVEWAQGTWRREWTADQNLPTPKKGDKLAKEWRFAWTANKNALLVTQVIFVNGEPKGQLDALFGWGRQEEAIVGAGYGTNGISGRGWVLSPDDKKFTITAGNATWDFLYEEKALVVVDAGGARHTFQRVAVKQ